MHEMWNTRTIAMRVIESSLSTEASTVYQAFSFIDEMLDNFNSIDTAFYRIAGLTLLKGRNLAQGIFSMTLDGLAQEAGALLRPLIECIERLTYFYNDPLRINEAIEGKLPSAGNIGKCIQGNFENLRKYLNQHASHSSLTPESMSHLVNFESGDWKVTQPYNEEVLRKNMTTLFAVLILLLYEAANCLACNGLLTKSFEDRLNVFKESGLNTFIGVPHD